MPRLFHGWFFGGMATMFLTLVTQATAQEQAAFSPDLPQVSQDASLQGRISPLPPVDQGVSDNAEQAAFLAPPPPDTATNAELAKRIAVLEKRLAESAKPPAAAAPAKPLVTPSGRLQFDIANYSQNAASMDQFGDVQNAVGFRRARLALLGEYKIIDYIVEMDFANRDSGMAANTKAQSTAFKDVYVQLRELPVLGQIRVGHFKECFGLEQLTSDNYTTFMERSIGDEGAFVPGRNNGIMTYNWTEDQRATWAVGAFTNQTGGDQPPLFQYDDGGIAGTARVTYLPWYDEPSNGRGLLHLGLDYSFRSAPNDVGTWYARPESGFAPYVVNFSLPDVNNWQDFGTETALVYGPLSLQSEFFAMSVNREGGVSNDFYGMYAFVSYFLTGENRPYNRKLGVFDRVRPFEEFFRVRTGDGAVCTGRGAWEIAYRFSYIDMLDDLTTAGAGRAADHTIGLNWYLNPYTKIMWNYVHSMDTYNKTTTNRIYDGTLDTFMMRFAIDF